MDARASSGVAGNGVHSSSTMVIVASSRCWISTERAGVRRWLDAVEMRLEGHAVGVELAQLRQRHDLEAAGIRQDRSGPVHEAVQSAEPRDAFRAGPQHQVVGVAEHDARRRWRAPRPTVIAFTVPAVPTGMKAGVGTSPCAVCSTPARAAPSVAVMRWANAVTALVPAGRRRHRNRSDTPPRSRVHRPRASARCRRRRRPA